MRCELGDSGSGLQDRRSAVHSDLEDIIQLIEVLEALYEVRRYLWWKVAGASETEAAQIHALIERVNDALGKYDK